MLKKKHAAVTGDKGRIERAEARTAQAETRTQHAEARAEHAETRTEQAKTRAESAETRTEQAETRTELAKTRTEQAEIRTEQVETILQHLANEVQLRQDIPTRPLEGLPLYAIAGQKGALEQLTGRRRDILKLIAEGQNTKQIADILKVSPKTVEYHRMKLMTTLNLHDIPGLVRFALQVGLTPLAG
jgi:DNA-binding CsgD family transcriptional regulator